MNYILTGLLLSRLNVSITFGNSSLAIAGMCYLLSAGSLLRKAPQKSSAHWFVLACLGVLFLLGLLLWGACLGVFPPFYIPAQGMTALRQIVLMVTVVEFLLAAAGFIMLAGSSATPFQRWCGMGLALIGLGLGMLLIGGRPATPLGWLGRSEGYLGGIYLLIAIFSVAESVKLLPLERALRESEERFRASFEHGAIGMAITALDGSIQQTNAAFRAMLGYTRSELEKLSIAHITHADDLSANLTGIQPIIDGETPSFRMEKRCIHKDGHLVWADMSTAAVCDVEGKPSYLVTHLVDITERKQAEEALQASLREKEVLLKEIHHRVKNNMQVISSLVSLQSDTLDNPALRPLFNDLRDRVRTMALVHEKLYQSESLARVDFAEYTRSLLNYLWRAHGAATTNVRLTLDVQPVSLRWRRRCRAACSSTSWSPMRSKHAFRDRADGELTVDAARRSGWPGMPQRPRQRRRPARRLAAIDVTRPATGADADRTGTRHARRAHGWRHGIYVDIFAIQIVVIVI